MCNGSIEVVLLGTGTSHGVPMIGCTCDVCQSDDPRDRRTRTSAFIRANDVHVLIDLAPELRLQCIANQIVQVDAVLLTHHHADHIVGLDDLRRFNWLQRSPVPLYGTQRTLEQVSQMFRYAFHPAPDSPHSRPQLRLEEISSETFRIDDLSITPIPMMHGPLPVMGFRVGNFAYCTDCNAIPDSSIDRLQGLEVLVLDALRRTPHPAHFTLDEAVEMATRLGAKKTYFTHVTHELGFEETNLTLPAGMSLGYDGLRFVIE